MAKFGRPRRSFREEIIYVLPEVSLSRAQDGAWPRRRIGTVIDGSFWVMAKELFVAAAGRGRR